MRAALLPLLLLLVYVLPARAQQADIQKQLIQRQQQTDAFGLQLRQSQELLNAPPGRRAELESRQLQERQRLDNLGEQQLLEVRPDSPPSPQSLRPYERQKTEDERRLLTNTPAVVPAKPAPPPAPLIPPPPGGIILPGAEGSRP